MVAFSGTTRWRVLVASAFTFVCVLLYLHYMEPPKEHLTEQFAEQVYPFQKDLKIEYPKTDLWIYKDIQAHNYKPELEGQQETFATFLCTHDASIYDPYFAATLNLVYRNLWAPETASKTRPFTVFVAPFITEQQRDILRGAGAVVQELGLLPWAPNIPGVFARWKDQFSKLHFFNQTQWKRIVYMDSDAFPIHSIDDVWDQIPAKQHCDMAKLDDAEKKQENVTELCNYIFGGVEQFGGGVNGGFLVVDPNLEMHTRLLRNYVLTDKYENTAAEQSFFEWQFHKDSAFPYFTLPRKYNAFFVNDEDEGKVNVVHHKLWAVKESLADETTEWVKPIWRTGWEAMVKFYDSTEFSQARFLDGMAAKNKQKESHLGTATGGSKADEEQDAWSVENEKENELDDKAGVLRRRFVS